MPLPLASIFTTSYNYCHYLHDSLGSARAQTYENLEIVVVDNCSTDGSWELISQMADEDRRLVARRNAANLGALANFLTAYRLTNGEYCLLLNADDRLASPNAIALLVEALTSDPGVVLATSRRQLIDLEGNVLGDTPLTYPLSPIDAVFDGVKLGDYILQKMINVVSESSTLFRKSLLPADDSLFTIANRRYSYYVDVIWWLKLLAQGKAAFIAEVLGHYRQHGKSASLTVASSPASYVEWFHIVEGAKALGYLDDPRRECSALGAYARMVRAHLQDLDTSDTGAMEELLGVMSTAQRRLAELSQPGA